MFDYCAEPSTLEDLVWLSCYLTSGKHFSFYFSFLVVLALIALATPLIMLFGIGGALAKRSRFAPLRGVGWVYTSMVRGVPDIIFFLFVPIAMDQGLEYARHKILCSDVTEPVRQGNDFVVCDAAKLPLSSADAWVHETYGFALALVAYSIVFGAFAANVIDGALRAVPKGQVEAAQSIGMSKAQAFRRIQIPQMWIYALPGLSNLWMILIKADAAAVPARRRGHRLLGAGARRLEDQRLHLSASRLAALVFHRPARLLPAADLAQPDRLRLSHRARVARTGDRRRRGGAADGDGVRSGRR